MDIEEILDDELGVLQNSLGSIVRSSNRRSTIPGLLELLIFKKPEIEFRMEYDNHKKPHFHLNIGKETHVASISIINPEIIVGNLPNKYRSIVFEWASKNEENLLRIWDALKKGGDGVRFRKRLTD